MQKLLSGQKRVLWDESDENETNIKIWLNCVMNSLKTS